MFLEALFILAKGRNYPTGLLPVEWVNKQWSIQTMEQYDRQPTTPRNNMGDSHTYCLEARYCSTHRCRIIMLHA